MAKYDYAMFLKQRGQIAEPIVMKGGIVVSAYKKKGPVADPSNHRALMVSSTIAKACDRALRNDLNAHFDEVASPLQIGGRRGRGVAQAAHALTLYGSWKRQQKISHAALFVDETQAYCRVYRQSIAEAKDWDGAAARLFSRL